MLYSGAKGTMTPNNRLQRTALPRRRRTGTLTAAKGRFATLRLTASRPEVLRQVFCGVVAMAAISGEPRCLRASK
jgi:hypothetical protein